MRAFLNDLRYAGRTLRRSPGFALLAIGIMALGIGANTAVFSVVNGVLLKPLPYPGADRIVALRTVFLTDGANEPLVSIANFRDWRDQSSSFEAMASYRGGGETPDHARRHGRVRTRSASVDVAVLSRLRRRSRSSAARSRAEEIVPGTRPRGAHQPRVLAEPVRRRSRRPERTMRVGTDRARHRRRHAARFPVPGPDRCLGAADHERDDSRTGHNFFAVARLKPDVSLEQARAELSDDRRRLEQQYPDSNQGRGVSPRSPLAGRAGGRCPPHALPPVGRRRRGAADRLRQHRDAAARQGHRAHARDGGAGGARRQPRGGSSGS